MFCECGDEIMIWFFWHGNISHTRLKIMQDWVYSTKFFNPNSRIIILSNSINSENFKGIEVRKWDLNLFKDTPINPIIIEKYIFLSARVACQWKKCQQLEFVSPGKLEEFFNLMIV